MSRSEPSHVRPERPEDYADVRRVLEAAFPTPAEAQLVERVRAAATDRVAWVAERAGSVIGQVLLTPVTIGSGDRAARGMGLGPVSVDPAHQRRGVGGALIEAGLAACRARGDRLVVVLGHPSYYPRFGFEPAWPHGLYYGTPGENPAFMVRGLVDGALEGLAGEVRYVDAFSSEAVSGGVGSSG